MTQTRSPQPAPNGVAPKLFAALPPEVLNNVGQWLSKTDRNSLTRAVPGLNYHGAALWKDDRIYDHMVPRRLQHDAHEAPNDALGQQPEQAWVQLWRRLHGRSKSMGRAEVQAQAAQVGRIRTSARHDIQTVVPLLDEMKVLTIGRMPSADARQAGEQRRGQAFELTPCALAAAPDERVPPSDAPWPGANLAISSRWRQPKSLVPAGCNGLMAVVNPHDELSIWQMDGQALMVLPFQNPDFSIRATQVAFTQVGRAPRAIFYGDYAYGPQGTPAEDEDFKLHGLNICPAGQMSDFPYLELVRGRAAAPPVFSAHSAPEIFNASHLGVSTDGAALLLGNRGEVLRQRLPFSGARAVMEQFLPSRGFHTACVSASNNAVAMADSLGRVQVARGMGQQLKLVWHMAKPRALKQMALNADGSRLGLLRQDGLLDVWSLLPGARGPGLTSGKLMCRISFASQAIMSFDFSPYCHALLVTTAEATRLVLPLHKQFVVALPHLRGTGMFVPGMLRVVGVHDAALVDIDLGAPPLEAEAPCASG